MKDLVKKAALILLFLALTASMLLYPRQSLSYALTGLTLWYEKMVPALLPFMILSNLLIGLRLSDSFVFFIKPLIGRLFRLNGHGVYAVFIGFLCGFPMGARVTADLYRNRLISRQDAENLLLFTNNIGPIYFTSFVLGLLSPKHPAPLYLGMYGIPFLYGLYLCRFHAPLCKRYPHLTGYPQPSLSAAVIEQKPPERLLDVLDDAIMSGLSGITRLGGYMVLFNLLNLLPQVLLFGNNAYTQWYAGWNRGRIPLPVLSGLMGCLLEITSGISRTQGKMPFLILTVLPFGGFSCIAQTYSMIKGTDLSISRYIRHKGILTLLTALYYAALFSFGYQI